MMSAIATLSSTKSFPDMLKQYQAEIARALPRHLNPERMTRIALTEFKKNPKLGECEPRQCLSPRSLWPARWGWSPGLLGQCYLIPYGNECQLIPGYQGLLELVRRSGKVKRIEAQVVYERDRFIYRTGLFVTLDHEPMLDGERGEPRLAYAVAEFVDGGHHVEIMSRAQIEAIRDRGSNTQSAKRWSKKTPWDTDADEMWRKTVLRRLCKFLPKSVELAQAIALDEHVGRQSITIHEAAQGEWASPADALEHDSPHDADTGEAYEAAEIRPPAPLPERIAAAATLPELHTLGKEIPALRGAERQAAVGPLENAES